MPRGLSAFSRVSSSTPSRAKCAGTIRLGISIASMSHRACKSLLIMTPTGSGKAEQGVQKKRGMATCRQGGKVVGRKHLAADPLQRSPPPVVQGQTETLYSLNFAGGAAEAKASERKPTIHQVLRPHAAYGPHRHSKTRAT